eukprot:ANDGO_08583.mRNA.1 Putative esterase SSO1253
MANLHAVVNHVSKLVSNPNFRDRVKDSFSRQKFMAHIGCVLTRVDPGIVELEIPYNENVTQQHGFFHGGLVGTLADNSCGYAAFTLAPETSSVLAVEYKLNLMSPAQGVKLRAIGKTVKPGKTLVVCTSEIYAVQADGSQKLCAISQNTIMLMAGKTDTAGMAKL